MHQVIICYFCYPFHVINIGGCATGFCIRRLMNTERVHYRAFIR